MRALAIVVVAATLGCGGDELIGRYIGELAHALECPGSNPIGSKAVQGWAIAPAAGDAEYRILSGSLCAPTIGALAGDSLTMQPRACKEFTDRDGNTIVGELVFGRVLVNRVNGSLTAMLHNTITVTDRSGETRVCADDYWGVLVRDM